MESALTVLWLGRQLILDSGEGIETVPLGDGGDEVETFVAAVESVSPRPKSVRLVYQPDDMETHAAECARTTKRDALREQFAGEHPMLRNRSVLWACSRLTTGESGFCAALLWIETTPRLCRAREALASRGIGLGGAWTLVSLIEELEVAQVPSQPVVAVIDSELAGVVYAQMGDGARSLVWATGAQHRLKLTAVVQNALAHFRNGPPPAVLLVEHGEQAELLNAETLGGMTLRRMGVTQFIEAARDLSPRSIGCFLPPAYRLNPNLCAYVAAGGMLVSAVLIFALQVRQLNAHQHDVRNRDSERQQLEVTVNRLRDNRAAVQQLESLQQEIGVADAGRLQLLAAVVHQKPIELTIHTITINNRTFTLSGTAHEGVGAAKGPYFRFVQALSAKSLPWTLSPEALPLTLTDSKFTISGTYR